MLKNYEIIRKMTLEEKVSFILSKEEYKTSFIEDFKYPVFSAHKNPLEKDESIIATAYPPLNVMANTWNLDLIKKIGSYHAIETKSLTKNYYYEINANLDNPIFSEDVFQNGKMIQAYVNGLKEIMMPTLVSSLSLEKKVDRLNKELQLTNDEIIAVDSKPSAIVFDSIDEIHYFKRNFLYKKDVFGRTNDKREAIRLINAGCELVFVTENYDEVKEFFIQAVINYNEYLLDAKAKKITMREFEEYVYNGDVINEKMINLAVDKLIDFLSRVDNAFNIGVKQMKSSLSTRKAMFDEVKHNAFAKRASDESIVLLKNEDKVLPLNYTDSVAIIGEYAKDKSYQMDLYKTGATKFDCAYDIIGNYDINCIGFAHGYVKEADEDNELIEKACELASNAKYSLVYLYAKDTNELPIQQLNLLKALRDTGTIVIGILITNSNIDLSFDKYLNALLYVGNNSQELNRSIIDIVIGDVNPSGHLSTTLTIDNNLIKKDNIPSYCLNIENVKYEFGFGLSYSNFEYTYLEANENGVTFTITNKSNIPGYEVSYLFVGTPEEDFVLAPKMLKGFVKTYIEPGESIKVSIPFDNKTFRYYNVEKESFGILGGNYNLYVGRSIEDIRLNGVIKLKPYLDEAQFENEVLETTDEFGKIVNDFSNTDDKLEYYREKRGIPKAVKLIILIFIWIYYDFMTISLLLANFDQRSSLPITIALIVLGIVFNVISIILLTKIAKIKEIKPQEKVNDSLTKIVDKVKSFNVVARISYEEPIEEEEEIVEVEEKQEEEQIFDLDIEPKFDSRFNSVESQTTFDSGLLLNEAYVDFISFVKKKNIFIEPQSARSLFASIFTYNVVFIKSTSHELINPTLEALAEFFDCPCSIVSAEDSWIEPFDLVWKKENQSYVKTKFIEDVYAASMKKNNVNLAILDNVSISNFKSYFSDFIKYAKNPKKDKVFKLTEEEIIKLPTNICYLVVLREDEHLNIPYEIARYTALVDLALRVNDDEKKIDEIEHKVLSYDYVLELMDDAKRTYFIKEELWKKLDYFEEQINMMEYFEIGNKNILQIEAYTSMFMAEGADEVEAFDNALACKVVPIVKSLDIYKTPNGLTNILSLVDRVFGDDMMLMKKGLKDNA